MWYLKRLAERAGARLGGAFEHGLGEIIYTDQQQSWRLLKEFTRNSHARGWGRGGRAAPAVSAAPLELASIERLSDDVDGGAAGVHGQGHHLL